MGAAALAGSGFFGGSATLGSTSRNISSRVFCTLAGRTGAGAAAAGGVATARLKCGWKSMGSHLFDALCQIRACDDTMPVCTALANSSNDLKRASSPGRSSMRYMARPWYGVESAAGCSGRLQRPVAALSKAISMPVGLTGASG